MLLDRCGARLSTKTLAAIATFDNVRGPRAAPSRRRNAPAPRRCWRDGHAAGLRKLDLIPRCEGGLRHVNGQEAVDTE